MISILLLSTFIVFGRAFGDVRCNHQTQFPLQKEGFSEGVRGQDQTYYLQTTKRILKTNSELETLAVIEEEDSSNYQCQRVINHPDGQHVFSVCLQYGVYPYISAYRCQNNVCQQIGQTQEIWNCGEQFSKLEVVGNTLVVLNAKRDYPYNSNDMGRVMFMNYVLTDDNFYLKFPSYYLDYYYFGLTYIIDIIDFSIHQYEEDGILKAKMFLADRDNGLFWVDCQLKQNQLIPINKGRIELRPQVFMKKNQIFMTSRIISKIGNQFDILVASNNNDHYIVTVTFENEQTTRFYIKTSLNQYLDWPANNRLDVYKNYFAITYWSPNNISAINIYQLSGNSETSSFSVGPIHTILLTQQNYSVVFFGEDANKQIVLNYRSQSNEITQCQIN
ncbi:unnamed protein product (macronuclear) [Paramecium tetraurelia]|uniref:Transmembrane protein n=1 Tax=Paramecium tetraurelia TaxID=5888 RepID=A0BRM3_PARTE|nr:uncharacterized protein GSPATT00031421001 [Paramecium tetraurelia]CAK61190.1 unnamed protein product [Paramecium tetraurelia]|eukprot:XP_001428588.1 hypothetical protein (macronuclear) [Paramecium tetraurelia strain d4-2]